MSPGIFQKGTKMTRSLSALCTVLMALAMNALVATADFTFQTSPSSKQILSASSGLAVRWEVQPGNSPDSNSPAPNLLTVSLGYRDASGTPQVLFPPLNGLDSNVPLQSKEFTWAKIDFNIFTANKDGLPTLDVKSQFFVVIADQATGYRSNGQIFSIVSTPGASAPAASAPAPAASPARPSPAGTPPAPPAASPAKPPATGVNPNIPSGAAAQPPPATSTGGSSTGGSSTGGSSAGGSSTGGSSSGNDNNAPDADASSSAQPTSAAGSSPVSGQGSDAPQSLVSPTPLRILLSMNLVFGGALACMILF